MNMKAKIGAGILVIVLVIVLLTEGVLIEKQLQPNVLPLRFKEYRDDAGLTAVLEMDNQSGSTVVVWEAAQLIAYRDAQREEQEITIQRTVIPEGEAATLVVSVPKDCAWQMEFRVARFGPKQKQKYEAGSPVKGTIVYSDVFPQYRSKP
jgi:hypothetical protein